jgi:hypothetical protein
MIARILGDAFRRNDRIGGVLDRRSSTSLLQSWVAPGGPVIWYLVICCGESPSPMALTLPALAFAAFCVWRIVPGDGSPLVKSPA